MQEYTQRLVARISTSILRLIGMAERCEYLRRVVECDVMRRGAADVFLSSNSQHRRSISSGSRSSSPRVRAWMTI